jgi:hypothetical protein
MATRLYSNARGCPVDPCQRTVRPGHLMCVIHWRQVPAEIRERVWRTWRTWNRTHSDADWLTYSEARIDALDVFHKPLDTRP